MSDRISLSVLIDADPDLVWLALTEAEQLVQWMDDGTMQLQIHSDWQMDSPVLIKGVLEVPFENTGRVTALEPGRLLTYTHMSSLSNLPDQADSYTTMTFELEPVSPGTSLTLTMTNFPTYEIRKHLEFYWRSTVVYIKNFVETRAGRQC